MNRYDSNLLSFRRWASVLGGLLLLVLGGFYLFNVSAQTEEVKKSAEQNLALGRLAFTSRQAGPTAPEGRVIISNPDGSGQAALPIPTALSASEPAWSPDGTRIAFAGTQDTGDIFVINADGSGLTNLTNTAEPIREGNPSWSVTGKIAYHRNPSGSGAQIWVMNADGSGQAQFPGITQPFPVEPAWSPDGTRLAFVSGADIWVINADGTNEQRVTNSAVGESDPSWSPDGSKIVFTKSGSGVSVINADGTNEVVLASGKHPSWSPDGTKIAFTRDGILTMDANGANQVRIVANHINFPLCCDTIYEYPAWQPVAQTPNTYAINGRVTYNNLPMSGVTVNLSGTTNAAVTTDAVGNYQFSDIPAGGNYTVSPSFPRYYFTPPNRLFNNLASNQTGNNFEVLGICQGGKCVRNGQIAFSRSSDIFTINSDGTGQTNITNNAATDGAPNYSPDGSNIIFSTDRDGNHEIYRMNTDGSNPVRLTNNAAADFSPYYSPDGTKIVFVSTRDGGNEIYKMNADGSNPVRLTNNASSDSQPAFSPDGQKIVYVSNSTGQAKIWTMSADGSNQQALPDSFGFAPSYERPSYSPDGSKIIFGYTPDSGTQVAAIWTMNPDGTNRVQFPASGRSPSYSPDGKKVAYTCCQFDNTNRLRTINTDGSLVQVLTPSNTGNDFPVWQPLPAPRLALFDFDGDGRSDQSIFRPGTGDWWYLSSRSNEQRAVHWGLSNDVLAPADYDGDFKTDVAVWRASDGNFYILNSFDNTFRIEHFGLSNDIPTGGDWDADGKADLAVYRAGAQGVFYYRASMGNPQGNITVIPWGISGDKPVAGDYDGDGRTDAAVYRSGVWWIRQSSDGQSSATHFGLADDRVVPADYDGDGKTDLAVYRGGIWYLLRSAQGSLAFQFGISDDIPAPADYDGDGRTDAAIYRNGVWWILKTQSGTAEAISFGLSSDKPIPSAFVR
ncbi:MAG: DPP IV N-terminal domain-containing protein [Pyrinomonadaceae bacterium]